MKAEIVLAPAPWVERMTVANKMLAEAAGDPQKASRVWDFAEAARVYAIQVGLGVDAVNHAVAVKLKSSRLLAEAVNAGQEKGEIATRQTARASGSTGSHPVDSPKTLDDLGVAPTKVRDARKILGAFTDEAIDTAAREASEAGEELTSAEMLARARGAHVGNNSGDNEWYTPTSYIKAAVVVMGAIDLDPASSAEANEIVGATAFWAEADNGLTRGWAGRVWMNPPYAQPLVGEFCAKLAESFTSRDVLEACVLVNNATETGWFQTLAEVSSAICFPKGRVKFWHPRKEATPLQGQAVLYLGDKPDEFRDVFGVFGFTVLL